MDILGILNDKPNRIIIKFDIEEQESVSSRSIKNGHFRTGKKFPVLTNLPESFC